MTDRIGSSHTPNADTVSFTIQIKAALLKNVVWSNYNQRWIEL